MPNTKPTIEKKLNIATTRMLKLIDLLKDNGTIIYRQEFLDVIDMPRQRFRQIADLKIQDFRLEHIQKACKKYNVNVNWIFGIEKNIFRESKK